jgi:hypothetical protein
MMRSVDFDISLLDRVGELPGEYRHENRVSTPGGLLVLSNAIVKWSSVHRAGCPIAPEFTDAAHAFAQRLDRAGALRVEHGLGFVVHHVSTNHAFLLIGFWRDKNELWMAHYLRAIDDPVDAFEPFPYDAISVPAACVWELSPIWHEREAWSRYLFSSRDAAAKRSYLDDQSSGVA